MASAAETAVREAAERLDAAQEAKLLAERLAHADAEFHQAERDLREAISEQLQEVNAERDRYDRLVPAYETARDDAIAALALASAKAQAAFDLLREVNATHARLLKLGHEPRPRPNRSAVVASRDPGVRRTFESAWANLRADW
jgi:hypothetical protein